MLNFKQITLKEALDMVVNKDFDNLYFMSSNRQIDNVKGYSFAFTTIDEKTWFKRETIDA